MNGLCICDTQDVVSLIVLAGVFVFAAVMLVSLFRP